jgi:hypothetical protein
MSLYQIPLYFFTRAQNELIFSHAASAAGPPFHGTEVTALRIFGWRILPFSKDAKF